MSTTFRSLSNFNFRLWSVGALVSNVGTWMQRTAQGWLVLTQLTHNKASAVGVVMALQMAPQLLFLPWIGLAADYFDRRRMLLATQAMMGGLALGLGFLTLSGLVDLWHVYLFAFAFGTVSAFDAPARQAFVADLVGNDTLANAVALNSTSFNAARMVGPAAAGLCIAAWGTGSAFVINGVSFLAVLVSLFFLRRHELHPAPRMTQLKGGIIEGFRYVWHRRDLRTMLVMVGLIGTFGLNFAIYIAAMSVGVFHIGAGRYGVLNSIMAIGTITGALVAARREEVRFGIIVTSCAMFALTLGAAALMPRYWMFGGALIFVGLSTLTFTNSSNSLMQLSTAPEMRGRVMALRLAILSGGTPLGGPLVGWIADRFGPRWALIVGASSGIVAALIGLRYLITSGELKSKQASGAA